MGAVTQGKHIGRHCRRLTLPLLLLAALLLLLGSGNSNHGGLRLAAAQQPAADATEPAADATTTDIPAAAADQPAGAADAPPEATTTPTTDETTEPAATPAPAVSGFIPEIDTTQVFSQNASVEAPTSLANFTGGATKVCVVPLNVDPSLSPLRVTGEVTAPLTATMALANQTTGAGGAAGGSPQVTGKLYLALFNQSAGAGGEAGGCPPEQEIAQAFQQGLLGIVKAPGEGVDDNLRVTPDAFTVNILSDQGTVLGTANVSDLRFFVYGSDPVPAQDLQTGVPSFPTNVTMMSGIITISTPAIAGNVNTRLNGVSSASYPAVSMQVMNVNEEGTLVLTITNVSFTYPITPETVPGNNFINATTVLTGDITASGRLGDAREANVQDVAYPNMTRTLQVSRTSPNATVGAPPEQQGNTTTITTGPEGTSVVTAPGVAVPPATGERAGTGGGAGSTRTSSGSTIVFAALAATILAVFLDT